MEPPQTYDPVGQCIYCGSTSNLSDEHIVPYGLHGNVVLPASSCPDCAKITTKLEQYIQRRMLGPTRLHFNLQTRRPKERPDVLGAEVLIDNKFKLVDVPRSEFPTWLWMFNLSAPGILRDDPSGNILAEGYTLIPIADDIIEKVRRVGAGEAVSTMPINPGLLCRFLAKVAHAYAVAEYGIDGFRPLLPNLILGDLSQAGYLVGGQRAPRGDTKNALHYVGARFEKNNGDELAVVSVHLFAFLGTPVYQVAAGFR